MVNKLINTLIHGNSPISKEGKFDDLIFSFRTSVHNSLLLSFIKYMLDDLTNLFPALILNSSPSTTKDVDSFQFFSYNQIDSDLLRSPVNH